MEEIALEQYYDAENWSEESWEKMVEYAETFWTGSPTQLELLSKLEDRKDIAVLINAQQGENCSLKWLDVKVPALDYLTPLECLQSPDLIKRLKVCLRRIHW